MGALKSKISQCNSNPDIFQRSQCQVVAYDEALGLVRGLVSVCSGDDTCKAKIMRAVGRLEVMKANAENTANEATPAAPTEIPVSEPDVNSIPNPGTAQYMPGVVPNGSMTPVAPPPQQIPVDATAQAQQPQAPPQVANTLPQQETDEEKIKKEFVELSKRYNDISKVVFL